MGRRRKAATKRQIVAIRTAVSHRGLDDPTYRGILRERFGVLSTLDLDIGQASELLDVLWKPLERTKKRPRRRERSRRRLPGSVVRMATPAQRDLIEELRGEIRWRDDGGFEGWLKRNQGLRSVRTADEAQRVIEGLKGLKR